MLLLAEDPFCLASFAGAEVKERRKGKGRGDFSDH